MKKVIIIALIIIAIFMTACARETTDQTTTTQDQTTTSEELTTTTQTTTQESSTTLTTTLFVPVYSSTIETDRVTFNVQINTVTIDDSSPVVTVIVEIIAKVVIDQELETSSYGDEGLIRIRIVLVENNDNFLYSEVYDIEVNAMILDVHLNTDDSLTRTMQFARIPFHSGYGEELPSPIGTYKIQVALYSPEMVWIDTGLFITVL